MAPQVNKEVIQMKEMGWSYASDYWNYFDLVHLVSLIVYFILRIVRLDVFCPPLEVTNGFVCIEVGEEGEPERPFET